MFPPDGAIAARELIDGSFDHAVKGLRRSVQEGNTKRVLYWLPRVSHLMNELNKIDWEIIRLRATELTCTPTP